MIPSPKSNNRVAVHQFTVIYCFVKKNTGSPTVYSLFIVSSNRTQGVQQYTVYLLFVKKKTMGTPLNVIQKSNNRVGVHYFAVLVLLFRPTTTEKRVHP